MELALDRLSKAELIDLITGLQARTTTLEATPERPQEELNRRRFELLADYLEDAFWFGERDDQDHFRLLYLSPAFQRIFGLTIDDLRDSDENWIRLVHPEDRRQVVEALAEFRTGDTGYDQVYRILRADGEQRWVHVRAYAVESHAGFPRQTVGIASDVTKEQEATLNALVTAQKYAETIRQSPDGFVLIDEAGSVVQWSRGQEEITGYSFAEVFHRPLWDVQAELAPLEDRTKETAEVIRERIQSALVTGSAPWLNVIVERPIRRKNGATRIIQVRTFPIHTAQCLMLGSFMRDVTEQRAADAELRANKRRLEAALQELRAAQDHIVSAERMAAIGQLTTGIAQEFNNLMATAILYVDLIQRSSQLQEVDKVRLDVIRRQTVRAAELIEQLLDFSRRTSLNQRLVSMRRFLATFAQETKKGIPNNIRFELRNVEEHCQVEADPDRLRQALQNLVNNGCEAMPNGGALTMTARCATTLLPISRETEQGVHGGARRWLVIALRDTGSGMAQEQLARVMDPFYTTKGSEHSGLGLPQVYGLVKQHHGHVEIQSVPGQGTTVEIFLPLASDATPQAASASQALQMGNGETVLVVEGNSVTREALVNSLETLNYRVLQAADVEHGIEICRSHQTLDAIIVSTGLPSAAGWSLVDYVGEHRPQAKLILLTGLPHEAATSANTPQVVGVLSKPISLRGLSKMVAMAVK